MHIHGWSIDFLMDLMPWERQVYVDLLQMHIKEEAMKAIDDIHRKRDLANAAKIRFPRI